MIKLCEINFLLYFALIRQFPLEKKINKEEMTVTTTLGNMLLNQQI